ncbi:MAG: Penicillin binding protein transpeptidase protein [Streptosporangiaceae bacterium]|nr:Penicillin binding protein transpeptidase protein [Streptosporangiaceae bacterium]
MRSAGVAIMAGVVSVALVGGIGCAYVQAHQIHGSPSEVARRYFAAWSRGDLSRMAGLSAHPPRDFADQHRALSRGLSVTSVGLLPDPVIVDRKNRAHVDFAVSRDLSGHGQWSYRSTLRLGIVDRHWKAIWSPSTLHPGLAGPGSWKITEIQAPAASFVSRDGRPLPEDGTLQPYVAELSERFGGVADSRSGWAVEFQPAGGPVQRLKVLGSAPENKIRTTVDRRLQAAADRAVSTVAGGAAIVALRPSTGEILAVADRLGARNAFLGLYPPGSAFKVVTAAGLLSDGLSTGTTANCPGTVVTGQRTIRNHDGSDLGTTTLREAFAQSCNTTFAALGVERLRGGKLGATAREFGFGGPIAPGPAAARGSFPDPGSDAELAEAAFGQGRVQASPLLMATVAAAVADGTWRSPRMVGTKLIRRYRDQVQRTHPLANAAALRTMMRAVVTDGTAARAGLPAGSAGKTGTAEHNGGADHAWFIGYQGDLAFAVFVENGGSGPKVAAPLAARFLRSR